MTERLLKQQARLQKESDAVIDELELMTVLGAAGIPVRVGSSALGLMVWRDVDLTVICPSLRTDIVSDIGARLMRSGGVREVRYVNDSGGLRDESSYPDGLYLGLRYVSHKQNWKIDIWFVDEPDKQPDLQHLQTIPDRLTRERRNAILAIKDIWAHRPAYGKTVTSYDIYTAVLDSHVTTLEQFDTWVQSGKDGGSRP